MELLLFILLFVFGGAVIGILWRWRLSWLLALCALLGFAICLIIMHDWSWSVWLVIYFILFGVPAAVGGACGFALRQMRGRLCRR